MSYLGPTSLSRGENSMEGAESGRKKYRLISVLHKVQEAKALVRTENQQNSLK